MDEIYPALSYEHAPQEQEEEPLSALDLPKLYQHPPASTLLTVLAALTVDPVSWDTSPSDTIRTSKKVNEEGIPAYLTQIISSPLSWIEDEETKELVWELAAKRLGERSGRTGRGDLRREFRVPLSTSKEPNYLTLTLHEPALQGDNLGLKTWAASYLLAKRLVLLRSTLPALLPDAKILELGAGTGLVGLAAAAVFGRHVVLTDLPEIVGNLRRNVEENAAALSALGSEGSAEAAVLDWERPEELKLTASPTTETTTPYPPNSFPLILSADPLYTPQHPALLVQTISHHLSLSPDARMVVELPLREAFAPERRDFRERMEALGLHIIGEGEEVGFDDWVAADGGRVSVGCAWGVWGWA